ncbi:MAG: hypothetical protein M5U23_05665 [Acidimicrobiia bacterium]|nr:hypothetical protein [Acidimicrobiia bacterium]
MNLRDLNWPGIALGTGVGLFSSLLLFVVLFGLGNNAVVQIIIFMMGFFISGYVAGRFALTEPRLSGGFAALGLFFAVAVLTITGDGLNLFGLVVFGTGAALLGPAGGAVGYNRSLKP